MLIDNELNERSQMVNSDNALSISEAASIVQPKSDPEGSKFC